MTTVRDFTQVFDAYAQFEELALSKKMEEVEEQEAPGPGDEVEIELRMGRFEHLMDRYIMTDLCLRDTGARLNIYLHETP